MKLEENYKLKVMINKERGDGTGRDLSSGNV